MPFRSKLKRALGGGASSDTSSLSKTDSKQSKKDKKDKSAYPDNVYKPGEPMPRPKYRGPWNQAHQDKLSAFSFGSVSSMVRRRSSAQASDYSPMGSKLPSRAPSRDPSTRGPSRRGSAWSTFSGGSGKRKANNPPMSRRGSKKVDGLEEVEDGGDDDVANGAFSLFSFFFLLSRITFSLPPHTPSQLSLFFSVFRGKMSWTRRITSLTQRRWAVVVGLSRQHTAEHRPPPAKAPTGGGERDLGDLALSKTVTSTHGYANGSGLGGGEELENQATVTQPAQGKLFTEDELAQAMSQSTIKANRTSRE